MPTLFLRALSPATEADEGWTFGCTWLRLEDGALGQSAGVTDYRGLAELLDSGWDWTRDPANVVLIVPGELVLGVSMSVPGRHVSQIRRALPFAVEEFVATDIEGMHLAHGTIRPGEPVRCNLVERTLLEDWLSCLRSLGAEPGALLSEAELLPNEANTAYLLLDGEQVLLKTALQAATVDRVNLLFALQALQESQLRVVNGELTQAERSALGNETELALETAPEQQDSTLGYLANRWRTEPTAAINLLQGAYKPKRVQETASGAWSAVGGLAAAWFALATVVAALQGFWSDREAERLGAEGLAVYQALYPDDRRANARNYRPRAQSKLDSSAAGGEVTLLKFVDDLGSALGPSFALRGVNFNGSRPGGELTVDLLAPDYNRVDGLEKALEERGYAVDVLSAQQQEQADNQVRARLRLTGVQAG